MKVAQCFKIYSLNLDNFLNTNYSEIMKMARKISKHYQDYKDLGHYAIQEFMEHERAQELVDNNQAMKFLSGIMWRSWYSSTSRYHTIYRDKGRMEPCETIYDDALPPVEDYDYDKDLVIDAINGILDDMVSDKVEVWFRSTLFRMYLETPNYSELSRKTGIPRTSISKAVDETKEYVKKRLKDAGIDYDFT